MFFFFFFFPLLQLHEGVPFLLDLVPFDCCRYFGSALYFFDFDFASNPRFGKGWSLTVDEVKCC